MKRTAMWLVLMVALWGGMVTTFDSNGNFHGYWVDLNRFGGSISDLSTGTITIINGDPYSRGVPKVNRSGIPSLDLGGGLKTLPLMLDDDDDSLLDE